MTKLDAKYNFKSAQLDCTKKWNELNLYNFNTEDADIFSIDTPPPTISGSLHIGHIFSYCHTDFIARYHRMRGKNVFYPCGFDNNGLPTERLIEKKHKIKANKVPRKEFLDLCKEMSDEKIEEFKNLFDEIGFSFDWGLKYNTNDKRCQIASQKSFLDLYKRGLIYKKLTPMFWDTIDQTAIAQAEVEEKEFESCMNYINFKTEDGQKITIATTRPELLPACAAVFFHPQDKRYQKLQNCYAITPIFSNKVPILADEDVLTEKGTGLVMCCTFGDETDVKWWQKHNLPTIEAIDKYGKLKAFDGQTVQNARKSAIEQLKANGDLIKQDKIVHSVKCAERSGAKLEIIPTLQWYIKVLQYKDAILQKAKQINWLPHKMRIKIEQWIEGIKWDWCISRQRYLGVPIPVWYDKQTKKEILPNTKDLPIDPKIDLPSNAQSDQIIPETDVLDTWATSSLTPQINSQLMQGNAFKTMDLRPQAHEIIRTWAFYTILRTLLNDNLIPWNGIMISGWCLAHDKTKMSKSKGNTIDPTKLLQNYGADVVRYWAASASLGADTYYNQNVFLIGKKLINKIWNASKFACQFAVHNFDIKKITYATDVWIINQLSELVHKVEGFFEAYDYCLAKSATENFFLKEYCDNYLELVKARAYGGDFLQRQSAANALSLSLGVLLKLFAPFFPYITDKIYSAIFLSSNSVHQKGLWPVCDKICVGNTICTKDILFVLSKVREFKSERQLSLNAKINSVKIITPHKILQDAQYDIQSTCGASKIEWKFINAGKTNVEITY